MITWSCIDEFKASLSSTLITNVSSKRFQCIKIVSLPAIFAACYECFIIYISAFRSMHFHSCFLILYWLYITKRTVHSICWSNKLREKWTDYKTHLKYQKYFAETNDFSVVYDSLKNAVCTPRLIRSLYRKIIALKTIKTAFTPFPFFSLFLSRVQKVMRVLTSRCFSNLFLNIITSIDCGLHVIGQVHLHFTPKEGSVSWRTDCP